MNRLKREEINLQGFKGGLFGNNFFLLHIKYVLVVKRWGVLITFLSELKSRLCIST